MKRFFLIAGLFPLFVEAQTPAQPKGAAQAQTQVQPQVQSQLADFTLTGRIGHFNTPAKIYFDYMAGTMGHSDSVVLVDGAFRFSGKVDGPATVRMVFSANGESKEWSIYHGDVSYFYIGGENIRLTSRDSLGNAVITGSAVYDAYIAYNKEIGGSIMELDKVANADFNSGTEEQKKDTVYFHAVDKRFRQKVAERSERELAYFSVCALSELTNKAASVPTLQPVFEGLSEKWRNSFAGKELADRMAALTAVVPGAIAPDFTQNDVSGKPLTLSSLRGKYVLVDFWASWCSPCRAENPNLVKQYQLYKDKGFQVLSVSLDDKKERWTDAIAKDGMPWLHVCDLKGWLNDAAKLYGVRAVPSSFLVDPQGKIVATGLRGEELDKKLGEVFAN